MQVRWEGLLLVAGCCLVLLHRSAVEARADRFNAAQSPCTSKIAQSVCLCSKEYRPVCCNGTTFANPCIAKCAGAKNHTAGPCPQPANTTANVSRVNSTVKLPPTPGKPAATASSGSGPVVLLVNVTTSAPSPPLKKGPTPTAPIPDCVCAAVYLPVCGVDGKDYSNACMAACAGVKVKAQGACAIKGAAVSAAGRRLALQRSKAMEPSQTTQISTTPKQACPCGRIYRPVCGLNRKPYNNPCLAACAGVGVAYPGPCRPACAACPTSSYPYCAAPARGGGPGTYANCCFAKCSGVNILSEVLHPGPCSAGSTICSSCSTSLEEPLCCQNQRRYKNSCWARCNREDVAMCTPGRCSSMTEVGNGLGCLMGPCAVRCSNDATNPVCGSDGKTYPNSCQLLCSSDVAVVNKGACGVCGPSQTGGTFPFCTKGDNVGLKPVCGVDGQTYRNPRAAQVAQVRVAKQTSCSSSESCGGEGATCYSSGGLACCRGLTCDLGPYKGPEARGVCRGSGAAVSETLDLVPIAPEPVIP